MPEVSVIIPLYNKGPHIARAIHSVLNQTIQDFEIIVMDGNSTDNGPEIVRNIRDPRIVFAVQRGTGVSAARNQAVTTAKSGFIAFLDSDDEWTPGHLETLLRLRKNFPRAGLYSTAYEKCLKDGKIIPLWNNDIPKKPFEGILPNYFRTAALGDQPIWTSVTAIPKKIFIETGGFPEDEWLGEDLILWTKVAFGYPIAYSTEIGGIYHADAVNRTCDKPRPLTEEPAVRLGNAAIREGTVPIHLLADFKEYIAYKEIYRARMSILAGNFPEARKILLNIRTRYHKRGKIFLLLVTLVPPLLFRWLYSTWTSDSCIMVRSKIFG